MDCISWAPLAHGSLLCSANGRLQQEMEGQRERPDASCFISSSLPAGLWFWPWLCPLAMATAPVGQPISTAIAFTSKSLEGTGALTVPRWFSCTCQHLCKEHFFKFFPIDPLAESCVSCGEPSGHTHSSLILV